MSDQTKAPPTLPGLLLIDAERRRQIEAEGWTPEHDDQHTCGELAAAAVCYAAYATGEPVYRRVCNDHAGMVAFTFLDPWPWDEEWDKRDIYHDSDPLAEDEPVKTEAEHSAHTIRCLVKAGALIAAEIDRLLRKAEGQ